MKRRHKRRQTAKTLAAAFFAVGGGCMTGSVYADDTHEGPLTSERIAEQEMTCFYLDDHADTVDEDIRDIFNAVQEVSDDGPLVTALVEATSARKTPFCYGDMDTKTNGLYDPYEEAIFLSEDKKKDIGSFVHTSIHEMFHGEQDHQRTIVYYRNWDISQRQMHTFSMEASARAIEYAVAYDAFTINAEPYLWENVRNKDLAEAFEDAYLEKVRATRNHSESLKFATSTIWHDIVRDQNWLDYYNDRVLRGFVRDIQDGVLSNPERFTDPRNFSEQHFVDAGVVDTFGSLTEYVPDIAGFPEWSERFGNNEDMKNAFDYMALERLAFLYGRTDARYLNELETLELSQNPYLGLDVAHLNANELGVVEQMNCVMGDESCTEKDIEVATLIDMRPPIIEDESVEDLIVMPPPQPAYAPQLPRR